MFVDPIESADPARHKLTEMREGSKITCRAADLDQRMGYNSNWQMGLRLAYGGEGGVGTEPPTLLI